MKRAIQLGVVLAIVGVAVMLVAVERHYSTTRECWNVELAEWRECKR